MGSQRVLYNQPKTLTERKNNRKRFIRDYNFQFKMLIDTIDNNFDEAFAAWPERYWVIYKGIIVFMAEVGPHGFKLDLLKNFLLEKFPPSI